MRNIGNLDADNAKYLWLGISIIFFSLWNLAISLFVSSISSPFMVLYCFAAAGIGVHPHCGQHDAGSRYSVRQSEFSHDLTEFISVDFLFRFGESSDQVLLLQGSPCK